MARYRDERMSRNADQGEMKVSDRHPVRDKKAAARKFKRAASRTKGVNMAGAPMRGGIRL